MSAPHKRPLSLRLAALIAACLPAAGHCGHDDYALQPTFCDDWCRVLLRPGCDLEPENCVRECEASVARGACLDLQRTLLTCYERTRRSDWECVEVSFQEIPRPRVSICQAERDALIGCEYPRVLTCIETCRSVAQTLTLDAGSRLSGDRVCPGAPVPCDSMCWALDAALAQASRDGVPELDASGSLDVPDASAPPGVPDAAVQLDANGLPDARRSEAGTDSAAAAAPQGDVVERLFLCAAERAAECYAPTDAGDAGARSANWLTVARDCARALGAL